MRSLVLFAVMFCATQVKGQGYNYDHNRAPIGTTANLNNVNSNTPYAPVNNVEFEKEFYTYTAPENEFNDIPNLANIAKPNKKNLQVIFIKSPENNGLTNALGNLVKNRIESKTAIYVLTKQNDVGTLSQQLQNLNTPNLHKPEVHFVKYRTEEDARNAQRTIQQQYESLGGKTKIHNGGEAPVLNFASKEQVRPSYTYTTEARNSYIPPKPSNVYLPKV